MSDEQLLKALDTRFAAFGQLMDARFEKIDSRFETVEEQIRHLGVELEDVRDNMITALAVGIDSVREDLDTFKAETNARFDRVDERLVALEATRH